jgi:hypothetical protein
MDYAIRGLFRSLEEYADPLTVGALRSQSLRGEKPAINSLFLTSILFYF